MINSFKKYLQLTESIEHFSGGFSLDKISNENLIKFSLFCAEDCYDLIDNEYKSYAKNCIDTIKKYLKENLDLDRGSNVDQPYYLQFNKNVYYDIVSNELGRIGRDANAHAQMLENSTNCAISSSAFAAFVFYHILRNDQKTDIVACAENCYTYAALAFFNSRYPPNSNKIYNKKIKEYTNLAKSLLSTTKFKHTDLSKNILKHDQKIESIMALLDHLSEENENLVLHTDIGYKLNLPSGYDVEASTYDELIRKIVDSPALIEYLKHLYT